jgi:hypothetical protein
VEKDVLKFLLAKKCQEGQEVVGVAMRALAIRQEPEEVDARFPAPGMPKRVQERRILEESSVVNLLRDNDCVLLNDPAGAKVNVSGFRISLLAGREADGRAGRFQRGPGAGPVETIENGRFRQGDCVPGTGWRIPEAVNYRKNSRVGTVQFWPLWNERNFF